MSVIVLVPAYKAAFDADEEACVQGFGMVFKKRDIAFVMPEGLDSSWYTKRFPGFGQHRFADKYFRGTKGYNRLLLSEDFYEAFSNYEYMLIAQPDAALWSMQDKLDEFVAQGYDYYGAPWEPPRRIWEFTLAGKEGGGRRLRCCKAEGDGIVMGNGGFSLRHIARCRELIQEFSWRKCYWFIKRNEDIFFGVFGRDSRRGFKPASLECGRAFAAEYHLKERAADNDLPYAVHGWSKDFESYNEMKEYLAGYGVKIP